MTQKAKLRPVKPSDPCLICNGTHKCSRGDDGVIMCGRPIDPAPMGFVYLGLANGDDQFGLYRVKDDEKDRQWRDDRRRNGHSSRNGNGHGRSEQPPEGPTIDWDARARQYAAALTSERRHELAVVLDLPEATIASAMPLLGSTKEWDGREVWTFPEEDGEGRIIGIRRRYRKEDLKEDEKDKKSMPDAKAGITVLEGWDRGGPFFGPEGATDNFTINAMGLTGAGRPSNTGGGEHLAHFLRDFPPDRRIIILGENDKKADGKWPGLEGAKSTAAKLSESLGRKVDWCLTPNGAKDARAWAKTQIADREDMDAWSDAGEKFAQACLDQLDDDEEEADVDDFAPDESTFRPFPLATLPEPIRSYVEAGAASVNCDPSFVALPMLTTLAAAIGNSRRIQLKKGWSEPAIIWTGIIGESGTTKSPAIDLAKEFP
ncbi:MAG TPA: DUF3987 domain-containing protein, partial [Gemmataceae bacterium]|nr:DUF3987 domain-containing protein [Gemmataceae bacterium]